MTEQQEKDLRIHLATLCMAVKSSPSDLRVATDSTIEYVKKIMHREYIRGRKHGIDYGER